MTDELAQEVAETSPSPEDAESSQETSPEEKTVAAEPDSPPESADSDSETPKPRSQKRIEQLSGDNAALRDYGEYWRRQALATQAPAPAPLQPIPKPTMEQFDHDPDRFAEATVDWATRQATSAAETAVKTQLDVQAKADRQAALLVKWEDHSAKFAEAHPDYHAVVTNPTIQLTTGMIEVMAESEKGPDMAYHLGLNPAKAARIARMSTVQQAAAIGRLEAEVSKPAPKPQPTSAPTPPTPVGGQQPTVDVMNLPIDDYMATERARLFEKRR